MKKYIKEAVKELQSSDKTKIIITLKSKNDYKKNFIKLLYNKFILTVQTRLVPSHIKNFILRTTGMNVGCDVCVPHYIYFDPYFTELITLEKGSLIGGACTVHTHQIKGNKLTLGKIILKERTLVGGLSVLLPSAVVSKNSILSAYSELDKTIPEGEIWWGMPAKLINKLSKEDLEKYFKESDGDYKGYYKTFKKKVKDFLKDPEQKFLSIYYNGKRLNAGDDWWRARNFFRIWYNGIIIETTKFLPHCFIKTLLLKMAGVKIGKNCKIGKGVVFDHIFCDNITLEDNVILDDNVYLDGHDYTITKSAFGKTLIKKGAHLKHHTWAATGTEIGENTVIEPNSGANRVIPANEVWGGVPAKFIKKLR